MKRIISWISASCAEFLNAEQVHNKYAAGMTNLNGRMRKLALFGKGNILPTFLELDLTCILNVRKNCNPKTDVLAICVIPTTSSVDHNSAEFSILATSQFRYTASLALSTR